MQASCRRWCQPAGTAGCGLPALPPAGALQSNHRVLRAVVPGAVDGSGTAGSRMGGCRWNSAVGGGLQVRCEDVGTVNNLAKEGSGRPATHGTTTVPQPGTMGIGSPCNRSRSGCGREGWSQPCASAGGLSFAYHNVAHTCSIVLCPQTSKLSCLGGGWHLIK